MPFLDDHRWFHIYAGARHAGTKSAAIFLDRDGVIILEKHYLRDPDQVELCPGVAGKLDSMRELGVPLVVVTNQSGIGQGLFGWTEYELVHQRMLDLLQSKHPFAAVYANAYHPADTDAAWRKPNPGMLLQAAADLNLCLASSLMVGDKWVDMEAARRAGVGRLVHVKTGHGEAERQTVIERCPGADLVDSLAHLDLDHFCAH